MKAHVLNWAFFWLMAAGVLLLLLVWLVANEFAGTPYQFFGPGSRSRAAGKIQHGLDSCPPDHIRILWFRQPPFTQEEHRDIDFSDATYSIGGLSEGPAWFEWQTLKGAWHTSRSSLTAEQIIQFKKIIELMPASNSHQPMEESLSVAINQAGQLRIYHYQFDGEESFLSVPAPIADLCAGSGLTASSK